jgi:hypothetical protein
VLHWRDAPTQQGNAWLETNLCITSALYGSQCARQSSNADLFGSLCSWLRFRTCYSDLVTLLPLHCAASPLLYVCLRCSGGFLTDHFPSATKAIWHFDGIYASSRHIPGVRFAGLIHPGEAVRLNQLHSMNVRSRLISN